MAKSDEVRQLNVRLPVELIEQLEAIRQVEALVDGGVSTAEVVRRALEQYVATCREDPEFQARRKTAATEHRKMLDLLK